MIAKLADGRIVLLLKDDVNVQFSPLSGWSLVARPLEVAITTHQSIWWVQSTEIVWRLPLLT
jgi:hypothetical protein